MKLERYYSAFSPDEISRIAQKLDLLPKTVELLFSRELNTAEKIENFLHPSKKQFHDPFLLKSMTEVVKRIKDVKNEKVLIFGDYDVDGISATYIMLELLEKLGNKANFYLPNRFVDGYGLTITVVDKIIEQFSPDLLITVDCGISCSEEIAYAKAKGIEVIVTDHHEIPEILPDCLIINPKLCGQDYPFDELCGTGVALKIAQAILGNTDEFLPVAALATVADIVPLTDENRAIVSLGLKLCELYLPSGLKSLFRLNNIDIKNPDEVDVSFKITPKLNAAGRMGEASDSLALYREKVPLRIKHLISKIYDYNARRQDVCAKIFDDCCAMLKKGVGDSRCIVLASKEWDHGVLGIVCSKLVDIYHRPVFLFANHEGVLKGSARSIPDINVHMLLQKMGDILETFGGHTMAAGLSLKEDSLITFKRRVEEYIALNIRESVFIPIHYYDTEITANELSYRLFNEIQQLAPFGCGNNKPLLRIASSNITSSPLKNFGSHLNVYVDKKVQLIYFNGAKDSLIFSACKESDIIFELQSVSKDGICRGILKELIPTYSWTFPEGVNALAFEQIKKPAEKADVAIKTIDSIKLAEIIVGLGKSAFGTLFVATSIEDYQNFISNFCLDNIHNLFILDRDSKDGFHSLALFPQNTAVFQNYKRIIFLGALLDNSFLSALQGVEIFVLDRKAQKNMLEFLSLSRDDFAAIYHHFIHLKGKKFINVFELHKQIKEVSFATFYAALLVFEELKLVSFCDGEIRINSGNSKTELKNSRIYNTLSFLKEVSL